MDAERFDVLARNLIRFGSRRSLLRSVISGSFVLVARAEPGLAVDRDVRRRDQERRARRDRGGARPNGRVAGGPTGRISNGTPVPQGTYTFAASIQVSTGPTSGSSCSGSLIDSTHVLTAAHCTVNSDTGVPFPIASYTVVVGQVDRFATGCARCRKRVTAVAVDPGWTVSNTVRPHDVAVLTLDSPVDPAIARPIALVGSDQGGLDSVGRGVTAIGWGITTTGGSGSRVLMQVPLTVVDPSTCRADAATIMCTSVTDGRDTCSGDSGGPLFVDANGLVQVALVSGGPAGCPSQGSVYGALNARLSNPAINAFVRASAPGAGQQPPSGPPDGTPPTVTAAAPAAVQRGQPFTISASVIDDVGVTLVDLYDCTNPECTLVATATSAPYTFGRTLFASGTYAFVVRAFDTAGNWADSDVVRVVVKRRKKRR